jgi:predicted naringenin-chalcone synthase
MYKKPEVFYTNATTVASHVAASWYAYLVIGACIYWLFSVRPSVYILDFSVYKPPSEWRVTKAELVEIMRRTKFYKDDSLDFMARMLDRSGTGENTHWPGTTVRLIRPELAGTGGLPSPNDDGKELPIPTNADTSIGAARLNAELVMFTVVEDALKRTRTRPRDVDFLIVNCSMFCPTPSLCSSICQRFGMRSDIRTYNLGGMGCSAGLISLDLAKQLLENRPHSIALVVSFEDITRQLYEGNERSMLLQNTLFRVGGAAIVLSNRPIDGFRAKYKILHTVRVQDVSEASHRCVYQREDPEGKAGVELSKDITVIAAKTLRDNLTILGPHVLPIREQARVVASYTARAIVSFINDTATKWGIKNLPFAGKTGLLEKPAVYVPDFKLGIQHFCIHAGGRAVIDGIEANLRLEPFHTAPSRATLRDFGNTSSSSIWYELKYAEGVEEGFILPHEENAGHRIKRGERVVQLAFGSGFKTNSSGMLYFDILLL